MEKCAEKYDPGQATSVAPPKGSSLGNWLTRGLGTREVQVLFYGVISNTTP